MEADSFMVLKRSIKNSFYFLGGGLVFLSLSVSPFTRVTLKSDNTIIELGFRHTVFCPWSSSFDHTILIISNLSIVLLCQRETMASTVTL